MKSVLVLGVVLNLVSLQAGAAETVRGPSTPDQTTITLPDMPVASSTAETGVPTLADQGGGSPMTLRAAIGDLISDFGPQYPAGEEYLRRLDAIEQQMAAGSDSARAALAALQREALVANPLVHNVPILFVVREQYQPDHHNTETIFHTGEPNNGSYRPGGPLKILDPGTGQTFVLLDPGPEGLIRDPEVHFDGRKIVFAMRKARDENYSIYELEVASHDGWATVPDSLRRLTNERDATDIDPVYLPDGSIVFSSTREPKYCHCNMHIMANLHRMDGDGANIHQIGKSTLFEGHASLMPDGRVLYYRWEYVDRNFGDAQGLWTVHPDGTGHAICWANNLASPPAVFDGRAIPGTDTIVCTFGSCHDRPWGAMAIVDRSRGLDSEEAVVRIWPEEARSLVQNVEAFICDHFVPLRTRYEDPFPLVDPRTGKGGKYFLVSRNVQALPADKPIRYSADLNELVMGLYLVDVFGNEVLLHRETTGCFDPMPLAASPRPPVLPSRRDYTSRVGHMYVADVYQGTHMQGVRRGDVASLRVVESVEKRVWTDPLWRCAQFAQGTYIGDTLNRPAVSWAGFEVKRILGTVPVEADGSASFEVPAERFVYFQLLDRDGMMISTMRSGTQVQPGETQACIGCHDHRLAIQTPLGNSLALRRPPSKLTGWHGATRSFNYLEEIQPIWNQHCVRCHDFGQQAEAQLVLAGDKELVFNASYVELFRNWGREDAWLNTVGLGLAPIKPAHATGAHRSRLVELLRRGHYEVCLSPEEMNRIVTWIDLGGPYYPDYACAHPTNVAGRAPLSIAQLHRLAALTGLPLSDEQGNPGFAGHRLWLSFDRPDVSPCLTKLDKSGEAYREALAIIQAGQAELRQTPEADMPGFRPCEAHQIREAKYQALREREAGRRQALAEGRKAYDRGLMAEAAPPAFVRAPSACDFPDGSQPPVLRTTLDKLSAGQPVTVVCLGDSVTGVYYHTGGRRAYPEMLELALRAAHPQARVRVLNAGISGHKTTDALNRLQSDVLDHHPDLVTVMFGLNDLTALPLADFRANLTEITRRCREAGAAVILCTPNSVIDTPPRPIPKLVEYCQALQEVAAEQQIPVCDVYGAFETVRTRDPLAWRLLLSDEIHPNMDGHKLTAETLCRTITGRDVSLREAGPPQPLLPKMQARVQAGQSVRVLAMEPLDMLVAPAIQAVLPAATVEVQPWPTAGQSLAQLEAAAQRVRQAPPDLVVIAIPASVTPADESPSEESLRAHSWILNWSLSFGRQEWDVVVVAPSVFSLDPTPAEQAADAFSRKMGHAQDLPVVARQPGDTSPPARILETWFRQQCAFP